MRFFHVKYHFLYHLIISWYFIHLESSFFVLKINSIIIMKKTIMKKLFLLLCVVSTSVFSSAQTFPDPGKSFNVWLYEDPTGTNTWTATTKNTMTKDANNLASFQMLLPAFKADGITKITYNYQTVFTAYSDARDAKYLRTFTLDQDKTVTFYSKAWLKTTPSTYNTQFLCDAQQVSIDFIFWQYTPITSVTLPLPINGKSSAIVTIPVDAYAAALYQPYVISQSNGTIRKQWRDLNNLAGASPANDNFMNVALCNKNTGGRYKIMLDYPTMTITTAKVLDSIASPKIQVGTGLLVAPTDATFEGNNLGTFSSSNALRIGGSVNLYSFRTSTQIADVTAKLYYQITKTGYNSGIKELALSTLKTEILGVTTPATFSTAAQLDISSGLETGDYTLKVWYGASCFGDELLKDNNGSGYSASFAVDSTTSFEKPTISSNISIENGLINARFDTAVEVKLFTVTGQLINHTVETKSFSQAVPTGIYILYIDNNSHKIIVK